MSDGEAVEKKGPSAIKNFFAGGFGGACLVGAGYPLDTIKVRLQTMVIVPGQPPMYSGAMDCFRKSVAKDGILGLYRGIAAPLISVTPMYSICFYGYTFGKKMQLKPGQDEHDLNLFQLWNAGCLSGVFTTVIMVPGERIKCILQTQGQAGAPKFNGTFDCARHLIKEGGIQSLYRGTVATLVRDIPGSGAYFVAYEYFKRTLATPDGSLNPGAVLFSGGMAGVANWLVSIPPDVLKSRLQTAPEGTYKGFIDCAVQLVKNEGILAMYRGIGPVMLRAFPANAACFMGYELAMKFLNYLF